MQNKINHRRVWQISGHVYPRLAGIMGHKYSGVVSDINRLWLIGADHDGVMRNIRQLAFIDIFPRLSAIFGAENMRVTEVCDCYKKPVRAKLCCRVDSRDL